MGQIQKVADPNSRVNLPRDRGSKTEWHSEGHMGLVVTPRPCWPPAVGLAPQPVPPERARMVVWFEG